MITAMVEKVVKKAASAKPTKTNGDITNGDIAYALLKLSIADDDDYIRNMAYRNGAEAISNLNFQVTQGSELAKGPKKVAGIGKGIARLIDEFLNTGTMTKTKDLLADMKQTDRTPTTTSTTTSTTSSTTTSTTTPSDKTVPKNDKPTKNNTEEDDSFVKELDIRKRSDGRLYFGGYSSDEDEDEFEDEEKTNVWTNVCSRNVLAKARAAGIARRRRKVV